MQHLYYNLDGEPITHEVFCELKWGAGRVAGYHRIGQDTVEGYRISTVWLGMDHNYGFDDGPPLIFETMIFAGEDDLSVYMERYSTHDEAVAGHERALAYVRSGQLAQDVEQELAQQEQE